MEDLAAEKGTSARGLRSKAKLSIVDVVQATNVAQKEKEKLPKIEDEHYLAEILEIAGMLQHKHVMLTDSLSKEGDPVLALYENPTFSSLSMDEFKHTINYLIAVTSRIWNDKSNLVIMDRRKDKWQGVKLALQYLEVIPAEKVSKVLILKPTGFFKNLFGGSDLKQLKPLSHHEIELLESEESLRDYLEEPSLPVEFGGTNDFDHMEWIEHRTAVERFEITCRKTEDRLKYLRSLFTKRDPLTSIPDIEEIAASHRQMLNDVEDDIRCTKDIAETLETIVIKPLNKREVTPLYQYNIECLKQWTGGLDEMRNELENLWEAQDKYLEQSISICTFELDFGKVSKEILQATSEITGRVDIGETMETAEELMKEYQEFSERSEAPHGDIKELHERGRKMLNEGHFARESIEIRVEEVDKLCSKFEELSRRRRELLQTNIDALTCLQQLNNWCKEGVDLLASQPVDRFQTADGADKALKEIDKFITSQKGISLSKMNKLPSMCRMLDSKVIDEKMKDALKRIEEVKEMFSKRESSLKKLSSKAERPVQPVHPQSITKSDEDVNRNKRITVQPRKKSSEDVISSNEKRKSIEILPSFPQRPKRNMSLRRSFKLKKKLSLDEQGEDALMARKMRQVVKELVETEYDYVEDLQCVVEGYFEAFDDPAYDIPQDLRNKKHIVFGNIIEIYNFHSSVFLKELKTSDGTSSSIGKIFTEKKEDFQLYEDYCQNKLDSEVLREQLQNTVFAKECQSKLGHQLPLDSYLLKPVQRITKYQLLIGEMMKYTNKKSPAYGELQGALDTMKKVLRHLNDVMHSSGLVGYLGNMNSLGKLLLQDAFVVWEIHKSMLKQMSNLRGKNRQLFLYEKGIIVSKKELQETDNGKEDYVYQFKDEIKIDDVGLKEHVKGDESKFEITFKGGKEIRVLQAKSKETKNGWVGEIRELLLRQFDKAKEKMGLRNKTIQVPQPILYSDPATRNSAPNIPQLLSPANDSPATVSPNVSSNRKFSFNNAISSPRLEQNLQSLEVKQLTAEARSSSDNPLWSPDDDRPATVYLSPALDFDGESDDGLWSDNEFDDDPDDEKEGRAGSLSSGFYDVQSQGSHKSRETYTAVADYTAIEVSELTFQQGDCLELVEYGEDGWWFMENTSNGTQGWAPASYLEAQGRDSASVSMGAGKEETNGGSHKRLETAV